MRQQHWQALLLTTLLLATLGACDRPADQAPAVDQPIHIDVWFHTGQAGERATMEQQIARFNDRHSGITAHLTLLPEGSYNAQVQAAALAGALPDVLEFDGPFLYNYAWQGHLLPLEDLLADHLEADLLPSILAQGRFNHHLYALGTFDSGLGLWAHRHLLEQAGITVPATLDQAWTIDEFDAALASLAQQDADGAVLDLKLNYQGEWFTYAFSPILQSAGADLIDRQTYQSSDGVLNSPTAVQAMERLQSWFDKGYVDANVDDAAFINGRTALSWVGHWEYPRYAQALGADLVLLPLPNFGHGSVTGQGSWNWGISNNSAHPHAAMAFIEFLLSTEEILAMTQANGAIPATRSATQASPLYGEQGALHLFVKQLETIAIPRPQTPAYPIITAAFQQAFADIRHGAEVKLALDHAAAMIDEDIRDNRGYPAP